MAVVAEGGLDAALLAGSGLLRVQRVAGNRVAARLVGSAARGRSAGVGGATTTGADGTVVVQRGDTPTLAELDKDGDDFEDDYQDEESAELEAEYAPPPGPTLGDFLAGPLSVLEARLATKAEEARREAEKTREAERKAELEAEAAARAQEAALERARVLDEERRALEGEAGEKTEPPQSTGKRKKRRTAEPKAKPRPQPKAKPKVRAEPQPKGPAPKKKSEGQKRHEREQRKLKEKQDKEEQARLLVKAERQAREQAERERAAQEAARAEERGEVDLTSYEKVTSKSAKQQESHAAVDVFALARTIDAHAGVPQEIGETFNRYINGMDAQGGLRAGAVVAAYQTRQERGTTKFSVEVPLPGLAGWVLHAHLTGDGTVASGENATHYKRARDRYATQMSVTLTSRQKRALLPSSADCLAAARRFAVPGH